MSRKSLLTILRLFYYGLYLHDRVVNSSFFSESCRRRRQRRRKGKYGDAWYPMPRPGKELYDDNMLMKGHCGLCKAPTKKEEKRKRKAKRRERDQIKFINL